MKKHCKHTVKALCTVTQLQPIEKIRFINAEQILYPYPQTPFPWKGAILLGLPPLVPVGGYAPQPHFDKSKSFSTNRSFYTVFHISSLLSSMTVKGPSFRSSTFISAPKRPVCTSFMLSHLRHCSTIYSYSSFAMSGAPAFTNDGR